MKRTYFVSFATTTTKSGFGNSFLTADGPIMGMDDIRSLEKIITDNGKFRNVKIINFDPMLFPDDA